MCFLVIIIKLSSGWTYYSCTSVWVFVCLLTTDLLIVLDNC